MNNLLKTKNFDGLYDVSPNAMDVVKLEKIVFAFARAKSLDDYDGGYWQSIYIKDEEDETNSFWYFAFNDDKKYRFNNENKQKIEQVSSKCLCTLSFMFALSYMINEIYEMDSKQEFAEELTNLYYGIKNNIDKVLDKDEVKIFYSIID